MAVVKNEIDPPARRETEHRKVKGWDAVRPRPYGGKAIDEPKLLKLVDGGITRAIEVAQENRWHIVSESFEGLIQFSAMDRPLPRKLKRQRQLLLEGPGVKRIEMQIGDLQTPSPVVDLCQEKAVGPSSGSLEAWFF